MDKAEQPTITQAQYESAVKGRQDFRNAYRNLLPVMRAAEGIVAIWRAKGRKVDVTEYWDAINAIDVAVTGGGAKPDPEHLTRTTSLAAQDGLDDHFPSGLRQRSHQIATAGDVVDGPVCVDCHCGASFSATDEGEARQLWASHAMAAMERPKTAAQDGLVEAVAEALLSAFLAGRGSVTADGRKAYKPAPSMADFRNIALSAIKEQHHD